MAVIWTDDPNELEIIDRDIRRLERCIAERGHTLTRKEAKEIQETLARYRAVLKWIRTNKVKVPPLEK